MRGMTRRAVGPRPSGTVGTSRQPSSRAAFVGARSAPRASRTRVAASLVGGKEREPDGVLPGRGQLEGDDLAKERVRDLDGDAGAVARGRLCAGGSAVVEVVQRGQRLGDDVVARRAAEVGHEGDAAGIGLEARVVEPLGSGHGGEGHAEGASFRISRRSARTTGKHHAGRGFRTGTASARGASPDYRPPPPGPNRLRVRSLNRHDLGRTLRRRAGPAGRAGRRPLCGGRCPGRTRRPGRPRGSPPAGRSGAATPSRRCC